MSDLILVRRKRLISQSGAIFGVPRAALSGSSWAGPSTGLTHRWPMDDANVSGSQITDVVGTLHGTLHGGVTSGAGPTGGKTARVFNGSTGYIDFPSSPAVAASAHTIGFWLYLTDVTAVSSDGAGTDPRFFNFFDGAAAMGASNRIAGAGAGAINFVDGAFNEQTSAGVLASTTWAHLAITFDGTSTYAMYVNGSAVSHSGDGTSASSENVLGGRAAGVRLMDGRQYQFVIYDRALSAGEVTTLCGAF